MVNTVSAVEGWKEKLKKQEEERARVVLLGLRATLNNRFK